MPYDVWLPRVIENDCDYVDELRKCFDEYNKWIDNTFIKHVDDALNLKGKSDLIPNWKDIKKEIEEIEKQIIIAINEYYYGKIAKAQKRIRIILRKLKSEDELSFLISDIDESYATRLLAPFPDLHCPNNEELYKRMNEECLSFFRARVGDIESYEDMFHIPLNKRDSVSTQRFSVPGTPCLYLGTSSYDIWTELRKPAFNQFCVSGIKLKPINERKEIKILNLISGIYLDYRIMNPISITITEKTVKLLIMELKIWLFACATSFRVNNSKGAFHSEYIVSHLIMQCLRKLGIDGVAYISKQIDPKDENISLPLMVNIAIPVFSESTKAKYAPICSKFEISAPVNFREFLGIKNPQQLNMVKCYSNKVFTDNEIRYAKKVIDYKETYFSDLDDFLCSQKYYNVDAN